MNNKRINKIVYTMLGLTVVSGVMFGYQTFVLNAKNEQGVIYVAKKYIPPKTNITKDMFEAVSMPKGGVLSSYVTNLNEINGKELKGGLLQNEPLTKQRLSTSKDLTYNLEIKLIPDKSSINVGNNDYVNVYVVLKGDNNKIDVQKIFDSKQVIVDGSDDKKSAGNQDDAGGVSYIIKVDEDEALKYYDAVERGKIIFVKNDKLDTKLTSAKDYEPNSEIAQSSKKEEPASKDNALVTKKVEKGDTLESLALQYKTTTQKIVELNNGKTSFNENDEIILPAN